MLVTTTLTPGLGPLLPRLAGIVAETGSVLSHLAILARESGVATVVGYTGATDTFADGTIVRRRRRHRRGLRRGGVQHEGHRLADGLATMLIGRGLYMVVSLNRWEWNRALFFGLIVLIAEVGLAAALILRAPRPDSRPQDIDPAVLDIFRRTRPDPPEPIRVARAARR